MSFNLKKNEGPVSPSRKTSFDLSKKDTETGSPGPKKPAYWLFAVIALLVAGGAAWYFTGRDASGKLPGADSSATAAARVDSAKVASDSAPPVRESDSGHGAAGNSSASKSDGVPAGAPVAAAKLASNDLAPEGSAPVFAASFKAGAVSPSGTVSGVVAGIRKKMKAGAGVKVSVLGYASSEGGLTLNQTISQQRADAYKQVLVRKGIAEGDITAQGRGIENPVASNDTEVGRRKNRRVEVSF